MNERAVIHPGSLLEPLVLTPTGLSQSALARQLGFNQPQPVNELINAKRNMTPKMALLLERFTEGVYPAEFWLLAQLRWDLATAKAGMPPSRAAIVQPLSVEEGQQAALATAGQLELFELSACLRNLP